MEWTDRGAKIPCFLCGTALKIKSSVKGKPYFHCDPCGMQVFVRRTEGIGRLNTQLRAQGESPEIMALVRKLKALRAELGQVQEESGFWDWIFGNPDLEAQKLALEAEIRKAQENLKTLGKGEKAGN